MDYKSILMDIMNEGEPAFNDEQESETPAESSTETKSTEDDAPSQEGAKESESETESKEDEVKEGDNTPDDKDVPFHKNPRFKRLIKDKKELEEKVNSLESLIKEIGEKNNSKNVSEEKVPDEFVYLFGENVEAWKKFQEITQEQAEKLVEERFSKTEAQKLQAEKAQKEAERILEETMETISDEVGVLTESQQNEIYKIAMEYQPVDKNGNIDLRKAHALWVKLTPQKEKSDVKKAIAAKTTVDSAPIETTKKVLTSKDLRGKSFFDMARF